MQKANLTKWEYLQEDGATRHFVGFDVVRAKPDPLGGADFKAWQQYWDGAERFPQQLDYLRARGQDGWELVSAERVDDPLHLQRRYRFTFKRPDVS